MRLEHLILTLTLALSASGCFIVIEDDADADADATSDTSVSDTSVSDTGVDTRDTTSDATTDTATDATTDTATDTDAPDLCDEPATRAPIVGVDLSNAIFLGRPALPAAERPTGATEVRSFTDYRNRFAFDADSTGLADGAVGNAGFVASGENALAWSVAMYFNNGGSRATIVPTTTDVPTDADMARLAELDGGILVVPGLAGAAEQARLDGFERIEVALNAPGNADLFFVGSAPAGASTADLSASNPPPYVGFRDDQAALYVPWLEVPSAVDSTTSIDIPPAGAVAGLFARFETVRGIWKSPAGLGADVRGIRGLAQTIPDADLDTWNQAQINAMRVAEGEPVVWGARTRQADNTEWQYVATRRLAMYIETSIRQGTRWAAFEANDSNLWGRLEASVVGFLDGIWRAGGLQGARPGDAYFARVGQSTTSAVDIENGRAVIELGFAHLKPAEFIVLRIEVPAGVCL